MKKRPPKHPKDIAYLDANVISFYFDIRPEIQLMRKSTRQWWEKRKENFYICTSEAVVGELEDGGYLHQPEAVELVKSIAVLPGNNQVDHIAQYYITHYLAPKENIQRFRGDAVHLALCAFYKVDYLLTWDLKHLANINKFKQLKIMNARMNLFTPIITTPAQLLEETL